MPRVSDGLKTESDVSGEFLKAELPIEVTELGITNELKVAAANAELPIEVTVEGIVSEVKGEFRKAPLPIVVTDEPNTRLEIAFAVKAARPIVTTELGMVTCVKPVLPKAPSPIEVIVDEKVTPVRVESIKAIASIAETFEPKTSDPEQFPPFISVEFASVY